MRSTSPARSRAAAILAPPSASSRVMPASASAVSPAARSMPSSLAGTSCNSAPSSAKAVLRSGSEPSRTSIHVGVSRAVVSRRERSGVRRWESATTRTMGVGRKPWMRQVRSGSSVSTVPTPTRMASCRPRKACAMRRAGSAVIQRLSPLCVAMRPSSVEASFSVTSGRRCSSRETNPAAMSEASARSNPSCTAMPAACRRAMPAPSTLGSGSRSATTTRAMPASISASAQGGVRPQWEHGSSVT